MFEDIGTEASKLGLRAKRADLTTETAVESLAFTRDASRRLKAEYDDSTKKIKEQLKPFDSTRKVIQKSLDDAEASFTDKLLAALKKDKELPAETKNGVRLTVAMLPRLGLIEDFAEYTPYSAELDESDCREMEPFFRPLTDCIDWKKIEAHIEAGGEMPSFAAKTEVVSLRTKLPDVIE